MTDMTELRGVRAGVPLPNIGNEGRQPEEIIYARYTYVANRPAGRRIRGERLSYVVRGVDVMGFVKGRLEGRLPPHVQTRQPPATATARQREINVYVGKPCWVVIELHEGAKMHFAPGQPGITVEDGHGDDNCNLTHIAPDGTPTDLAGPDCRMLFFRVQRREDYERQKFHLHIVRDGRHLDDPDQVDPDIPNDGGKFPFPFIGDGEDEVRERD